MTADIPKDDRRHAINRRTLAASALATTALAAVGLADARERRPGSNPDEALFAEVLARTSKTSAAIAARDAAVAALEGRLGAAESRLSYTPTGHGSVTRELKAKLNELGNSVADYVTLADAIAAAGGNGVNLLTGERAIQTALAAAEGQPLILRGNGDRSLLRRVASDTAGPHYALHGSGVHVERVAIMLDPDAGATNSVNIVQASSRILLDRVRADGGVVLNRNGIRNTLNNIALVTSGPDISDITIRDGYYTRFMWGLLQPNTTVRRLNNIRIQNTLTDAFAGSHWLFNAPAKGAGARRILVSGNFIGSVLSRQPFGSASGYPHRVSFAGGDVRDIIFAHNFGSGYGGELARVEEGRYGLIVDSVASELNGQDGFEMIPNGISGTIHVPEGWIVSRLILRNSGLVSSPNLGYGIGIHVYTSLGGDFTTADAARSSIISNNYMAGWRWGYSIHQGTQTLLIADNLADGNQFGFRTWAPSVAHSGWMLSDNVRTASFERGGTMGDIHVASKSGRPSPIEVDIISGPGSFTGWSWTSVGEIFRPGITDIPIAELGRRIHMDVQIDVSCDRANHSTERGTLIWTGAKAIYHRRIRDAVGSAVISENQPLGVDGGNLVLRVVSSNATPVEGCRIQVWTRGVHKIGA